MLIYVKAILGVVGILLAWVGIELAWRRTFNKRDQDGRLSGCSGCTVCRNECHKEAEQGDGHATF